MDLPIRPVKLGDPPPREPPAPPVEPPAKPEPPLPEREEIPPPVFFGEELDRSDVLVYVVDRSGSMSQGRYRIVPTPFGSIAVRGASRMDLAKVELARSIAGLSDAIRFNVIAYDCVTISWRAGAVNATPAAKAAAIAWVGDLKAEGGTATGPSVVAALQQRPDTVVLLTDGDPSCSGGIDSLVGDPGIGHRRVIAAANQGAVVNVFGIDARGPYRRFCQGVAADNSGSFYDVR